MALIKGKLKLLKRKQLERNRKEVESKANRFNTKQKIWPN